MFVITVDQMRSSITGSRAASRMQELQHDYGSRLLLPIAQFAGDELQFVTSDPDAAVELALLLTDDDWHVGIGIGAGQLAATAADSHGPAFQDARDAVTAAKSLPWHMAVRCRNDSEGARDAEAALAMLHNIRSRRSDAGREIAELVTAHGSVTAAATELDISVSAASKRARIAGIRQEELGIRLANRLVARVDKHTESVDRDTVAS